MTWVLVVIAALLVPISVLTVWAIRTITNTDQYVATMAPLARQQVITDHVAVKATNVLFEKVDVQGRLNTALPPKASFAAAPIANQVHGFVEDQFKTLLRSTWFQQAWDKANRRLHSSLVSFLEGNQLPAGQKAQDIAIKLDPVLEKGITQLHNKGITVFDPLQAKLKNATNLSVTVASKPQVKSIRGVFHLAKTLGWVVPLVALVLIAAAVAVAVDRRKTLLRLGVGVSITTIVVLGLVAYERNFFITHAANRASPDVTGAVYDTLSHFLHNWLLGVLVVSVIVAALMWLIGPARWARSIRRLVGRGFHLVGPAVRRAGLQDPQRRGLGAGRAGGPLPARARLWASTARRGRRGLHPRLRGHFRRGHPVERGGARSVLGGTARGPDMGSSVDHSVR